MQQSSGLDSEEASEGIQSLSLEESIEFGVPHPGLPAPLPPGEEVVWQGVPNWRNLSRNMFYTRWIGTYFAVIALVVGTMRRSDGGSLNDAIAAAIPIVFFGILTVGILSLLAWIGARATIYTITNRRIIMRVGAAFSKSIDIPFNIIESVGLKSLRDGFGNISIKLKPGNSIPYFFIWPHARPWYLRNAQPMLRALKDVSEASQILLVHLEPVANQNRENEGWKTMEASVGKHTDIPITETSISTKKNTGVQRIEGRERIFVKAAVGLIAITLIFIIGGQYFGLAPNQTTAHVPKSIHEIRVEDLGSDRFSLIDLEKDETIVIIEPGRDGLVRNAIRSLKRVRKQENLPADAPYQLVAWGDNRLTLSDMKLNRHIPLSSFAPPNTSAAMRLKQLVIDKHSAN